MITIKNYFSEMATIAISSLPPVLAKSHEFVVNATKQGNDLDSYKQSDAIRKTIDLYLSKLNSYLESKEKQESNLEREVPNPDKEKQVKSRKLKTVQEPKQSRKTQKSKEEKRKPTAKKVEHIREEVKFIKRFVGLHNRVKSPSNVLSLLKGLQRAIVQKQIRKTSPLVEDIRFIQDKLIDLASKMQGDTQIKIKDKDLERLVKVAGGEEVYPSINIMKRYISLSGKPAEAAKIEQFAKHIEKSLENEKVGAEDPYRDKVKAILNTLDRMKHGNMVHIAKAELNGLEGIVSACSCQHKHHHNVSGLNGVLTAEEMGTRELDLLPFTSVWYELLGSPARNFTFMLHGEPHNGKTILLLKLAQYLANNFGEVLYISSEEFASPTMTKKVAQFFTPFPSRLHFAENLNDPPLKDYQFIIIDSVNDLGMKLTDFKAIRKDHPDTAFIFVLQHTKAGEFRGGKDWEHAAEIVAEVSQGSIETTKNRYAPKSKIDFFKQFGISWQPHGGIGI